jgi:hypothetical protein
LRSCEEFRDLSYLAETRGVDLYGIKGLSAFDGLIKLPLQAPLDYMHLILQGHGKWLINQYFYVDTSADYYLGK